MKFLDAARRTSTSLDSWRRPLFRTHPGAPGPSRPTREREQKAEQHLEDRSDNKGRRTASAEKTPSGLDASRRFTEGNSIGVGRVYGVVADRASTDRRAPTAWRDSSERSSGIFTRTRRVFVRTVVTANTREPVVEDATGEELVGHLRDHGAPRAVLTREAFVVHRLQAMQVV